MLKALRCNAETPLAWPVRPVARMLCDALGASKSSLTCGALLFVLSAALLWLSNYLSQFLEDKVSEVIRAAFQDKISKQVAALAAAGLTNLAIANMEFAASRRLIEGLMRVAYELGRSNCFAILVTLTASGAATLMFLAFQGHHPITALATAHPVLMLFTLATGVVALWLWGRYIQRFRPSQRIFDHDVGAALAHYRRR